MKNNSMNTKKTVKKLSLNKITIARLNIDDLKEVMGGVGISERTLKTVCGLL
ncbi:MAG: hypothetical protein GY940_44880 [bacterium]|nr:hypothetical protein [bacterium]